MLNDYVSDNKYNITLFTNTNKHLDKLVPLLRILEVGHSDILINSCNKEQQVEIKIKENIKLSSKFINDLSTISGIDHFKFSWFSINFKTCIINEINLRDKNLV